MLGGGNKSNSVPFLHQAVGGGGVLFSLAWRGGLVSLGAVPAFEEPPFTRNRPKPRGLQGKGGEPGHTSCLAT
jgi:hypothetical protein